MEIAHVEFNCIEFQDIIGQYHLIRGCSLTNSEEMRSRLSQLQKFLDNTPEQEIVRSLYDQDSYFSHLCHQCLELSGISLDCLDFNMMSQMLFPYQSGEKYSEGILVELNFSHTNTNSTKNQKGASYEEVIAALWSHTQDLQKAFEIANTIPANQLLNITQARAKQIQDTDLQKREKTQQREWQQKAREDLSRGQQ
jgi:hypothetical protein